MTATVRVRNVSPFMIPIDVPHVGTVEHGAEADVPAADAEALLASPHWEPADTKKSPKSSDATPAPVDSTEK